jgi:hypothetical protein
VRLPASLEIFPAHGEGTLCGNGDIGSWQEEGYPINQLWQISPYDMKHLSQKGGFLWEKKWK